MGGDQAFLFGYTPSEVLYDNPCSVGQNMLFSMDEDGDITHRFATYFGARLLTQEWTMPAGSWHEIYPVVSSARNGKGEQLVTGYAVYRPDGLWSLLLINKDSKEAYNVRVRFRNEASNTTKSFEGQADLYQFSGAQYELNNDANEPYPIKAEAPQHSILNGTETKSFQLPAYSLSVIRGPGPAIERHRRKLP
jgi:hypothetical protein